ncbi:MAG: helix-turn-helix transcriptional regulator [Chloroflexi bacterium]|nr:helix-turn-helix transcriptional regulator [Chloroflexota bacterium]
MIVLNVGRFAEEKGLSIQDLADRADISYNTAKGLYRGYTTRVDLPILDKICSILEVSPGDLLVQVPDNEPVGLFYPKKVELAQLQQTN